MKQPSKFLSGFNKAAKDPIAFPRYPYVDELPTFVSWPFVWVLARFTQVGPELIALTGFIARLLTAYLIALGSPDSRVALLWLLVYSILSDCADGQMARYRGWVSSLGALYDLSSDFVGSFAIFAAIGFRVAQAETNHWTMWVLTALALGCYFCVCTVWSYARFRQSQEALSKPALHENFLAHPRNDHKTAGHYQLKFRVLNACFNASWRLFARLVLLAPVWKARVRSKTCLHGHAFASLNIHWTVLVAIVLRSDPLEYFLYYELVFFLLLLLWLLLTETSAVPQQAE